MTCAQPVFQESAKDNGYQLYSEARGSPENVGTDLKAVHPVVRTNPVWHKYQKDLGTLPTLTCYQVTGWKSIFAIGHHAKRINEVTEDESTQLRQWFLRLLTENHDLQVRYRWQNPNDVAIWDNRSVYHTATYDYEGKRTGQRAVSLGEKPFYDPNSVSRREALGLD